MKILHKILVGLIVLAVLYGAVLLGEILTTQEIKRVSNEETNEAVCLMWKPQLLKGNGLVYLTLLNPKGKVVDSAKLQVLDRAFDALDQFGGVEFQGPNVTVKNLRTGELAQRFVVRDGRLILEK